MCEGGVEMMKKMIMYLVREDLSLNDCLLGWLLIEIVDVYYVWRNECGINIDWIFLWFLVDYGSIWGVESENL